MGKRLSRGDRNIVWIEQYCRIPDGKDAGKPVKLRPWQRRLIRKIYNTPTRTAIISFGRKNAKTTLSGFLCLLHTAGPEALPNTQLYSDAQSRDQAALLYDLMAKCVRLSADLSDCINLTDSLKQMNCPELGTVYRALSAEHSTAYGKSPVFAVHDELGQVRGQRSQLYEAIETGMGAHERPLSIIISTQAPTDGDLLSILIDDAMTGHDPETKLFLWTADPKLDPFKVATIRKANPALGDFLNQKEVMANADKARRMPSREADYRNLVLNQRVNRADPFITQDVWSLNGKPPRSEDFEAGVVMALDLSEITDLTCRLWVGQGKDGAWSVDCMFYAPEDGVIERSKKDRVPYDLWAKQGYLTLTPGRVIKYGMVADALVAHCEASVGAVELITFDRWHWRLMQAEIENICGSPEVSIRPEALPFDENGHGQGYRDMTPALQNMEAELKDGNIRHGNHPILTWCAANAVVARDPAGNRKLNKARSTGRIDGMVCLAMALNRALSLADRPDISDAIDDPVSA